MLPLARKIACRLKLRSAVCANRKYVFVCVCVPVLVFILFFSTHTATCAKEFDCLMCRHANSEMRSSIVTECERANYTGGINRIANWSSHTSVCGAQIQTSTYTIRSAYPPVLMVDGTCVQPHSQGYVEKPPVTYFPKTFSFNTIYCTRAPRHS